MNQEIHDNIPYNTLNGYIIECNDLIEDEEKCKRCLQNLGEEDIICWKKE